jgi:small neutral amino acid transporter SnatA (MarC family)
MALVPLACPMIAGPATIAACIGLRMQYGVFNSTMAMLLALSVNHIIMLLSPFIGRVLNRSHILSALIRITGLIVMTIGTQMALDGLAGWFKAQQL